MREEATGPARSTAGSEGRKDELVALITSVEPSRLDATAWLRLNLDYWGIEIGLHQRLDISTNDDRCRVRNDNSRLVLGMMLRLTNSLFMQWSGYERRPDYVTTTGSNPACPKTTTVRHSA